MAALLLGLPGCSQDELEQDADARVTENGENLFNVYCEECHPHSGRSDYLKLIPATLLTRRSELELTDWILGTENHREMPSFTNLTERERKDLAAYLFTRIDK